jgi:uncharacterized protein YdeI (YjbR/CyaY-like superfamily)
VRKKVNETSYAIRFTPRKSRSTWSAVNIKRMAALKKSGLVHAAGLSAFERRTGDRSEIYSYEQRKGAKLTAAYEKQLRANKEAWNFFQEHPPWYRRTATWRVISAKKEETRQKRAWLSLSTTARTGGPLRNWRVRHAKHQDRNNEIPSWALERRRRS